MTKTLVVFRAAVLSGLVASAVLAQGCGRDSSQDFSFASAKPEESPAPRFWTYFAVGLPGTAAECQAVAAGVASRFKIATGYDAIHLDCVAERTGGVNVQINYLAVNRLQRKSAVYGFLWYADDGSSSDRSPILTEASQGVFATYDACTAALPSKVQEFETNSGLIAVGAGCRPGIRTGFALRIDGFGTWGSKSFQSIDLEFQGKTTPAFAEAVGQEVAARGVSVSGVSTWEEKVLVIGWTARPVAIRAQSIGLEGLVDGNQGCATELAETRRVLRVILGTDVSAAACLSDSLSQGSVINFLLPRTIPERPRPWLESAGPRYANYAACASDRTRVVEASRAAGLPLVKGGICIRESGNAFDREHRMVLLSSRS